MLLAPAGAQPLRKPAPAMARETPARRYPREVHADARSPERSCLCLQVFVEQIDVDGILRPGVGVAPQLPGRETDAVHMLRLVRTAVPVGIGKQKHAMIAF